MKHSIHSSNLANGASLHFVEVPDSSIVEARLYFNAGFSYFGQKQHHVPHLLEHLLIANGSIYNSESKLLHAMQDLGATVNAQTDYEHITILLRAPYRSFTEALKIIFDCVFSMQLTEEGLVRERDIVLRELYEQFDGMGNRTVEHLLHHAFHQLVPGDWNEHLHNTTSYTTSEIRKAYASYITPQNMRVVVAGKMGAATRATITKMFRGLSTSNTGQSKSLKLTAGKESIVGMSADLEGSASLTYIFVSPVTDTETHKERVAFNVADQLLFDAPSAILPLTLREKGIVYSVTTELIHLKEWRATVVHIMTAADKAEIAAAEILKYLHLYANGHIAKGELDGVKRYISGMLSTSCETVGDLVEWYSRDILNDRQTTSVETEIELALSLTDDDVAAAVRTLFVNATVYGVVAVHDAEKWAHELEGISKAITISSSDAAIEQITLDVKDAIHEKRTAYERTGFWWAAYWILYFVSFIMVFRVSHLPLIGSSHTVSAFDFAWDQNWVWGLSFFVPLILGGVLTWVRGKHEKAAEAWAITLTFAASIAYVFALFRYFGDIGAANQPWIEDAASLLVPFFFFVATPIAFVSVVKRFIFGRIAKRARKGGSNAAQ